MSREPGRTGAFRGMLKRALLLLAMTMSLAAEPKSQVLEGTYAGIETGDYTHLQIKTDKGQEKSFFLWARGDFDQLLKNPDSYKGKRVRVTWRHVTRYVAENGGPMELDEVTSIQEVK
jgi:hypothetical protein